jgi:branched-chain amino acid transport system substrate-binding protein
MTRAAVTVLNKSGGINGAHVVVTVVNDGGTPTTGVTKLEAALNSSTKPSVVLDADASPEAAAELPILAQAKVFSLNQSPTATSGTPKKFPYSFDLSPSTTNYVQSFISTAKAKGYKKIAVINGNDAYGTAIGASMVKLAKAAGLTITGETAYKTTGLTYTATLSGLQSGKPQVLWADGYGAASGYLMQDIKKIGWNVPVMADDSFSVSPPVVTPPPTGSLGTTIEKGITFQTVTAGVYTPPSKTPKNVATMLAAMKRNGHPKASLLFGYEYDGVLMAGYAARRATATPARRTSQRCRLQPHSSSSPQRS